MNYAGIHSHAKPLPDEMISTAYGTQPHTTVSIATTTTWWTRFHDPQLNQLISTALNQSPYLQNAESRVREAQHITEMANANLWPSVDGNASIAREHITENTIFPPPYGGNNYTETALGLNFNYEFDFWGKNREILQTKISQYQVSAAEQFAAQLILTSAITTRYIELQSQMAELEIAQSILSAQKSLLDIIQTRAQQGVESDIPVTTVIANLQLASMGVDFLEKQVAISRHQLAVLTGQNAFSTAIIASPFAYHSTDFAMPEFIPANVLGKRPDILASRWRVESAMHQVNVAKTRFYPNINLNAILSLQSYALDETFLASSRDNKIGAAIDLPIFDAGKRRANLGVKYAEYDSAISTYNQTLLTALSQVADHISTLSALRAQEIAEITTVKAKQHNYDLILSRYQHGITDYTAVLQNKNKLSYEKLQQIALQAKHMTTIVAMIKDLGGTDMRGTNL